MMKLSAILGHERRTQRGEDYEGFEETDYAVRVWKRPGPGAYAIVADMEENTCESWKVALREEIWVQ